MRRRLLRTLGDHPHRAEIDADLTHLFRSWFNRGFLTLARIDWQTSAVVLERLIQYEAVHQIQGGTTCGVAWNRIAAAMRSSIRRFRRSR